MAYLHFLVIFVLQLIYAFEESVEYLTYDQQALKIFWLTFGLS